MTEIAKNTLEVGTNGDGEVVVNHPDLQPDENGVGHIIFSPEQARNLACLLQQKAHSAEEEIIEKKRQNRSAQILANSESGMNHKDLAERASRMAIPSSGDDAADQKALLDAALHEARMDENICPNGCGPMVWDDPNKCNVPYSGEWELYT